VAGGGATAVDMFYDNSTGDCSGTTASSIVGTWPAAISGETTAFAGMGVIVVDVTDYTTGHINYELDTGLYVQTAGPAVPPPGNIGLGFDLVVFELPGGFARKKKKSMEERLAEMEQRLKRSEFKDCKSEKDVKAVFVNEKLERTRRIVAKQQQLQAVVDGDISPTESLSGWVDSSLPKKLGLLKMDQKEKDQKVKG